MGSPTTLGTSSPATDAGSGHVQLCFRSVPSSALSHTPAAYAPYASWPGSLTPGRPLAGLLVRSKLTSPVVATRLGVMPTNHNDAFSSVSRPRLSDAELV